MKSEILLDTGFMAVSVFPLLVYWCRTKFVTSGKFLTYYVFSVIFLL